MGNIKVFICAIVVLMMMSGMAMGQCCGHAVYSYPVTYQYPVKEIIVKEIVTPVAIPVLVPAFQFQYVAPVAPATPAPAPVAAPTPVVPTANNEQVRLLARALLAEMDRQMQGRDDGPPMALVEDSKTLVGVLSNHCARCHTGNGSKAGVQIFSSPGVFNNVVDRQRLLKVIDEGKMPIDAQTHQPYALPADEKALVRQSLFGN